MYFFNEDIKKAVKKNQIPKDIAKLFQNAFIALDTTKDLNLFDIKRLVSKDDTDYFRLRKGKYRAIFTMEGEDFYVHAILKREEAYKQWP